MSVTVKALEPADLEWSFRTGHPTAVLGRRGPRAELDAFPCYSHDVALVQTEAAAVEARLPLGVPITIWVAGLEETSRTNGFSWGDRDYIEPDEGEARWEYSGGVIFLSGKRIPMHRAMTRYLVAHEYGHHVQYALETWRGQERDELHAKYSELRGLEPAGHYGGNEWHRSPGEVFACDFRILVAGVEPDHWPHPGIAHPLESLAAQRFWAEVRAERDAA